METSGPSTKTSTCNIGLDVRIDNGGWRQPDKLPAERASPTKVSKQRIGIT